MEAKPRPPSDEAPAAEEQIVRQVSERLAEDERLRGDLTDAGYQPIFNWVISLLRPAGRRLSAAPDPHDAGEELSDAARALVRALVHAATSGDTSGLGERLAPPLFTPEEAAHARQAVPPGPLPGDDAEDRAQALIDALSAARTGESAS